MQRDTHHADTIVEQCLAENVDEEELVDMDLFKNGNHRNRIDGTYQGGEEEDFKCRELHGKELKLANEVEGEADGQCVPDGADEGEQHHRVPILEELPIRHEVAWKWTGKLEGLEGKGGELAKKEWGAIDSCA